MKKIFNLLFVVAFALSLVGCVTSNPSDEHHFTEDWQYNETKHYHECTDASCNEMADVADHVFTQLVTKAATCTEKGTMLYSCECGYSYTEEIPMIDHIFDPNAWEHDSTEHWHECSCGALSEKVTHSFTSAVTTEPTYTTPGVLTYSCECGYSYTENFDPYAFGDVVLSEVPTQLPNGDFEDGYNGWYMSDGDKAAYAINSSPTDIWNNIVNATGSYLYGYEIESAKVTFHSSLFKLSGVGLITFKLAGNGTDDLKVTLKQYVADGDDIEITSFNNWYYTNSHQSGFIFRNYFLEIDMETYEDAICYFEVSDQKSSDFAFICLDDIVTYYEELPEFSGAWYKAAFVNEPENATIVPKKPVSISDYELANGDFETGWEDWNVDENVKAVYSINNSPTDIWNNPVGFNGNYLYGYYNEAGTTEFTSSSFKVGGLGLITFKMAGNCTSDLQFILMKEVSEGDDIEIAKFNNWYFGTVAESGFISHDYFYQIDLSLYEGATCYFKVVDNMSSNFAFVCLDDIVTYYTVLPEFSGSWYKAGFVTAPENPTELPFDSSVYKLANGDFEAGWEDWNVDENVKAVYSINNSPTDIWNNPVGFNGNYLYGYYNEAGTTEFTSSSFRVGGIGLITFKMAGNCTSDLQFILMKEVNEGDDIEIAKFNNWYFGTVAESGFISHDYFYQIDLSLYEGATCYFKVVDNMSSNFAFVCLDDIVTYYTVLPEFSGSWYKAGFVTAPSNPTVLPIDATVGQLANGDFEAGWEDWNVDENVKAVYSINNSPTDIWNNPVGFNGNYLYGYYNEAGTTEFTSSSFKVGGTGLITFKMAGNCTSDLQFILMKEVEEGDDIEIAKFNNWYFGTVAESGFISHDYYYQIDLSLYEGATCYFKVVDNMSSNFAFVCLDDIVTYYWTNPTLGASFLPAGYLVDPRA